MKQTATHNIICFEAEWQYNSQPINNRFNLCTAPILNCIKEYHRCDTIYRNILTVEDMLHYISHFKKQSFKKYDIVIIACHGWNHKLSLEGKDGYIDIIELANKSKGFFKDKIVHFSTCRTMANENVARQFKDLTGAKLVSGYQLSVDPMKSCIADMAYLNDLMLLSNVGIISNKSRSSFRQTYSSLLEELGFIGI
ncbi:MAG: hypothetical protein K2H79_09235 [Bacteroidaceae bacterium]|nr:hypothetical protein [Bacteroidaceae bacterium]